MSPAQEYENQIAEHLHKQLKNLEALLNVVAETDAEAAQTEARDFRSLLLGPEPQAPLE